MVTVGCALQWVGELASLVNLHDEVIKSALSKYHFSVHGNATLISTLFFICTFQALYQLIAMILHNSLSFIDAYL